MTRTEILATLARRLNKNTTLDTNTQNRLLDFVNDAQRELLSIPGTDRLRQAVVTFSSVSGTADYYLPGLARAERIVDTTNDRVLGELTLDQYRLLDPSGESGTPEGYVWRGVVPVQAQPSDASNVYAKSTSAADTTQTIYVEGQTAAGQIATVSVVLTGTTALAVSSVYAFAAVTKVYLSAACAGTVTLHEDSGVGLQLASIPIGATRPPQAQWITLWRTPSAVVSYRADGQRVSADLANASDEPLLPVDFHDLLIYRAMQREYEHMDDARAVQAERNFLDRRRAFIYWLAETATGEAGGPWEAPSRLGAWVASGGV